MVWAHTNGYGDFVLFDDLGSPWKVHDCYFERFDVHVGRLRKIEHNEVPLRNWEEVTPINPDAYGLRRRYGFIGTVTNVEKGFVGSSPEFRNLASIGREEVRKVLAGRTSLMTVVTGEGAEFTAFFDFSKHPLTFRDIVACDLKAVSMFTKSIFVVTQMQEFKAGKS